MPQPQFTLKATVSSRSAAKEYLLHAGDAVVVNRQGPRWLLISCPCGCGEELPINLDSRAGPAWRLYQSPKTGLSLYPSVWRDTGCKSHFVIWRNHIDLFGRPDRRWREPIEREEIELLSEGVYRLLPKDELISAVDIADDLNAVPWDVLTVCRHLVRTGIAREGTGKLKSHFGRAFSKDKNFEA